MGRHVYTIGVKFHALNSRYARTYTYKTYDGNIRIGDSVITELNGEFKIAEVTHIPGHPADATKFIVQKVDTSDYPGERIERLKTQIKDEEAKILDIYRNRARGGRLYLLNQKLQDLQEDT